MRVSDGIGGIGSPQPLLSDFMDATDDRTDGATLPTGVLSSEVFAASSKNTPLKLSRSSSCARCGEACGDDLVGVGVSVSAGVGVQVRAQMTDRGSVLGPACGS